MMRIFMGMKKKRMMIILIINSSHPSFLSSFPILSFLFFPLCFVFEHGQHQNKHHILLHFFTDAGGRHQSRLSSRLARFLPTTHTSLRFSHFSFPHTHISSPSHLPDVTCCLTYKITSIYTDILFYFYPAFFQQQNTALLLPFQHTPHDHQLFQQQ